MTTSSCILTFDDELIIPANQRADDPVPEGMTRIPVALLRSRTLSNHAVVLCMTLLAYAGENPSDEVLRTSMGISKRAFQKAVCELERVGYVKRTGSSASAREVVK